MSSMFGADGTQVSKPSGRWLGGSPADGEVAKVARNHSPEEPMVAWSRRVNAELKRERQQQTEEMQRSVNLAQGGTPWWRERPKWKIGTSLNYCATVPLTWTAILCDAKPSVSYTALDRKKQAKADLATSAWTQAYDSGKWEQIIHDAVLVSRVQKCAYLQIRPNQLSHGGNGKPRLVKFLGEQVYFDKNATGPDDAEIMMIEYPESYGSLCARFKGLRKKLTRKYDNPREENHKENQSVLSPPASYKMPASAGGATYNTPAYAASPNPPDTAGGTRGMLVREFWTRPHWTTEVEEVLFMSTGEPATQQKYYESIDPADSEPLRRVVTEGGVIYELPESIVAKMHDLEDFDGIKILSDQPALEVLTHKVKYPLYPDGRLVTIVDNDVLADDRMNPLGYWPARIIANSDPGGGLVGPSDVDLIASPYEQLVRFVSIVFDNANLTGNGIWRIPIGAEISNDDITNAPGSIQREDIMCLKFGKREPAMNLPTYIPAHIKFLTEQIKELSGLSDMAMGKMPPKAQISTETMTQNQEASGVRFRDSLSNISLCMRELGEQFLEYMARFYTSPVIVQIKNAAGIDEPMPMLGAYLTDPFIVEAKAGSRQPSGPSARLTTLLNLKNAGIPTSVDTIYSLLEEIGSIPSATAVVRQIEQQMADPKQKWKVLGFPPPPGSQQSKKPGSRRSKKQGAPAG